MKFVLVGINEGHTGRIAGYPFTDGVFMHSDEDPIGCLKLKRKLSFWEAYPAESPELEAAQKRWAENPENPANKEAKARARKAD